MATMAQDDRKATVTLYNQGLQMTISESTTPNLVANTVAIHSFVE